MTVRKNSYLIINAVLIALLMSVMILALTAVTHADDKLDATANIKSAEGAYMRASASTKSQIVGSLRNNATIVIHKEVFTKKNKTAKKYRWYYVTSGTNSGFVRSDLVKNIKYGSATGKAGKKTYYRAGAGKSMRKKGSFKKNKTFTIVMEANAKGSNATWYKVKKGSKYYYISSSKVQVTDVKSATPDLSLASVVEQLTTPEQSPYAQSVANAACAWAVMIANDNSFHYGNGTHSRHNGCYFCGTQPQSKKQNVVQWEKTYCCNPFITAAYAHGGNEPTMKDLCSRCKSWMAPEFRKSSLFANLGHPDKSSLKPGDILCTSIHVAMYIGNGKLVEAATSDNGVPGSSSWNSSIRVTDLTDKRYKGFNNGVFRYIGE